MDGLVIGECAVGEHDRFLTVLTANDGKITFIAKGARSMRSKTAPICRVFTYANFEYYEKNGKRWLSGGSVIDSFFDISRDVDRFALGSYVCQVAAEVSGEGVQADELLRMCLNSFYAIAHELKPLWLIKAAFELFCMRISGLEPDLALCSECRGELLVGENERREFLWLDVMNGHVICDECMGNRSRVFTADGEETIDRFMTKNIFIPIDTSALVAMRYVLSAPVKRIFAFGISDSESADMFSRAVETYLLNHLERNFDTLDFYKTCKE